MIAVIRSGAAFLTRRQRADKQDGILAASIEKKPPHRNKRIHTTKFRQGLFV